MVIENLQTTPLLEWLLGPDWYNAALLQPLALLILAPLLMAATVWLVAALRRGPLEVSNRAATAVGIAAGVIVLIVPVFAALWALDLGSGVRELLGRVAGPILTAMAWLFGQTWYEAAATRWLALLVCLVAATFAMGWLVAAVRSGPVAATTRSGRVLIEALLDVVRTSPRRVLALAWLAIRESIRRRVVVVFAVFLLLLLFAGWFLNPGSDQPARLYLQFVLTATSYLVLLLAWILSALSLPGDIKDKTIYTIVTKPVRQTEIVLGRVLGFAAVGTMLLLGMGLISYVFTVRGLDHTHELTADYLHDEPLPGSKLPLRKGLTSFVHHHQHEVTIDPNGNYVVETKQGHRHALTIEGDGADATYTLGPPEGLLVARVPVYGKLQFKDRSGKDVDKGVNVGDEWTYRSFIEGGSRAAAVWTFKDITEDRFPKSKFPDAIPVEMTIEVFRTHKGNVEKPILGSLWLRNPQTGRKVEVRNFLAKKFATDVQLIPRELSSRKGSAAETLDLFKDLVSDDGQLEIGLQCLEQGQYFGMAQADLYIRARDASFAGNFATGYLGIWLQMVIVLAMGVMFSTFLSGPVTMVATLGSGLAGLFSAYMAELATGKVVGGGPFESFVRIVTQQNIVSEMEPGLQTNVAVMSDHVLQAVLWVISSLLPAFDNFDFVDYVAYGFNVSGATFGICVFRAVGFLLPVCLAGYFLLKMREVAK